jgi:hypothetical protein
VSRKLALEVYACALCAAHCALCIAQPSLLLLTFTERVLEYKLLPFFNLNRFKPVSAKKRVSFVPESCGAS